MGPLITPGELATRLDDITVLDVRWQLGREDGREQHLAGHVPQAAYVDLPTELADPAEEPVGEGGRHPLPDPERFAAAMRRAGVSRSRTVVVYDDWSSMAATRAWWLLRDHAHPDVRVLDGGWSAWQAAGHPVESGERTPTAGDFTADPGHLPVVDATGAAELARHGVLVDARGPERFRGESEPVDPVAGHIPGAVNVPSTTNVDQGVFRPRADLATLYAATDGADGVAAYCGSGVTATHGVFALHLLGREAALYPGSWSGWVSDGSRPVAREGE